MGIRLVPTLMLGMLLTLGSPHLLSATVSASKIHDAVAQGNLEYLKTNNVGLFTVDANGSESLLLMAAQSRQVEIGNWLVQQVGKNSAYIDLKDSKGNTALYYAAFYGLENLALNLLRKGAKSSLVDEDLLVELMNNVEIRDLILDQEDAVAARPVKRLIPKIRFKVEKFEVRR